MPAKKQGKGNELKQEHGKQSDVQTSNIAAAKALADLIRTSLGPRGMDKMLVEPKGDVIITNDGATILSKLEVTHPCAKMLVDVSKAQDVEAGDGTSTVVVMCGALLKACQTLLAKNIHPTQIANAFLEGAKAAHSILKDMSVPVNVEDREKLLQAAVTSLNSKIVSQSSNQLAPMAVDAVRSIVKPSKDGAPAFVDLNNIKLVKVLGGTIDDTEVVNGMVFSQKASKLAGGPTKVANAKIGLIQFQLSPPKTDMENNVIVSDYQQMDRILKEERNYLLNCVKKIAKTGCNVLLIQKSILRDAVTEMSLHFLAQKKIMVVRDIERSDIDFICKTLGCLPAASLDSFSAEKLGTASLVEEQTTPDGKIVKVTGVKNSGTVTMMCRGATKLVVEEADRSLHDALCVIRCLYKKGYLIAGGGAPETELSIKLAEVAKKTPGIAGYCMQAYAEAFEIIPYTLAENAGLQPVTITTDLRNKHIKGEANMGINVRKGVVTDMMEERVIQPLLVSSSAVQLATETVAMILKIDDIVPTR
eukprot:TRINITY_DN54245_c0_g1_i1.p1 TRINITY_DN54245_c0_g1~~TRINITY_DN54245_c0_g1_i1.p1  ORF type:complete len:548 (+),score=73.72 TRINITY_DN54245_c0_g1_i1:49-1644(+)